MRITIYKIGVHYKYLRVLPVAIAEQLTLCAELWQDLVTVHEHSEKRKVALWSSFPDVAAAETEIRRHEAVFDQEETTEREKAEASAGLKHWRAERRKAIGEARTVERAVQTLEEINTERDAEIKNLYAKYAEQGLYWATINDVIRRRFNGAVKRVGARRAQGQPAQLQRGRFDGSGTVRVQLQRGAGHPPRTHLTLSDPYGKWRNVLLLPPPVPGWDTMSLSERHVAGRGVIQMRMGSTRDGDSQWVGIPVQMHRMIDPEAEIVEAFLTIRKYGTSLRGWVTLTAKLPDVPLKTVGPTVAFHMGWRAEKDGTTRTATWRSTQRLEIPERIRHVMRADKGGKTGIVVLPNRITDRSEWLAERLSSRAQHMNTLRDELIAWTEETGTMLPNPYATENTDDEDRVLSVGRLKQWRSPAKFAVLAMRLNKDPEWTDTKPARELKAWLHNDRRRWRDNEHGRAAMFGARDNLWSQVAAVIATQAQQLVIDDSNLQELARLSKVDPDLPAPLLQAAARRRQLAAPGELRGLVVAASTREGVEVVKVSAKNLSREHTCGYVSKKRFTNGETCPGCNRQVDTDVLATATMMKRAAEGDIV